MLPQKGILSNLIGLLAIVILISGLANGQTVNATDNAKPVEPINQSPSSPASKSEQIATAKADQPAAPAEVKAGDDKAQADTPPETLPAPKPQATPAQCKRMITANVVALPHPIMLNRLGATIPDGLIFALARDTQERANETIRLRDGKRARPLVLRANVGDCLTITFENRIPVDKFGTVKTSFSKTGTTEVSLHVQGMEWVTGPTDDGSFVGKNPSSLASVNPVPPGMPSNQQTYTLFAKAEGTYLLYTMGDTSSQGKQLTRGLFGALNVQPEGAEWYRSQVTATELDKATYNANNLGSGNTLSCPPNSNNCTLNLAGPPARSVQVIKSPSGALYTQDNHPLINYNAVDASGTPILKMLNSNKEIIYSDLTAIITGPNAGRFPGTTGVNNPEPPCNAENNPALTGNPNPLFCANPAAPDRKQPYREITTIYHGGLIPVATQAFPVFTDAGISAVVEAGDDAFAINYGTGGIASEVYANRVGVGPMGDCIDCKFEEFFLSAWSVGDPAMLVDKPANTGATSAPCTATSDFNNPPCGGQKSSSTFPYTMHPTPKAKAAFFPDDPSNVFHSYINDHVKFRILHGGRDVTHVHHQHAHQWLQSPNSDEGSYLDSQMISPGASYTLEMTYNGSGNRNKVVGDSIFHCHFYPHFAAGMWAMWRTHDTFEAGTYVYPANTQLGGQDVSNQVVPGSRALPDGEIIAGAPTPGLVPLPTIPMAPLPAYAQIQNNVPVNGVTIPLGGQVVIGGTCNNNKINGLDVIGGCTNGQKLNGTVISSSFNGTQMTGQFQKSNNNALANPGYPYFIPGIAGARPPHPPFDFAVDGGTVLDGGLPRHVVAGGTVSYESHDQFDWSKDFSVMSAIGLPETGTDVENAAINFFRIRCHQTFLPDGTASNCAAATPFGFILNGLPLGPMPGAPFADPAIDDNGNAVGTKRTYKAAAIQLDVFFNTKKWHFPQQRILTLWNDVQPTLNFKPVTPPPPGSRAPEPLFFRGNSGDIIEYWHTNLVPHYYLVDDFQVRTPTDILGQHIHLVKFDVTSSDGAGNGFNYEDGTFSPQEVQDKIKAINADGGLLVNGTKQVLPGPKPPPAAILPCPSGSTDPRCQPCPDNWTPTFRPQCQSWLGAQTTIQRWYIDPLVDNSNVDRTMRTVFTHDHFGPSTHQQAGLYAGLLIEPKNSTWRDPVTGQLMGNLPDGGPTSWKADILTKDPNNNDVSYREFMLEFQDLQLAYAWATIGGTNPPKMQADPNPKKGWMDPAYAINAPSQSATVSAPNLISTGTANAPPGTQTVNYRNEPIAWRLSAANDMSYVFDSSLKQATNANPNGDPFTPLMRAYQGDNVQVRVLVGAHVFAHQFNFSGPTWFFEPSWKNSGYRSAQAMGLSEHFEFLFNVPSSSAPNINRRCPDLKSLKNCVDYFYSPSMDEFGISNGMWGLLRSYDPTVLADQLPALPNNPIGASTNVTYATCPASAPKKTFNITAVTAQGALNGEISFNGRPPGLKSVSGVLYVRSEDLNPSAGFKMRTVVPVEPLILRANAGDCITINLTNRLSPSASVFQQRMSMAPPFSGVINNQPVFKSQMSKVVGLHPQLLSYDAARSTGWNIGWNRSGQPDQLATFGNMVTYTWYAGKIERGPTGALNYTPVEFGSLNLFPSDVMYQQPNGLFGSMIIEPAGATWTCDGQTTPGCNPGGTTPQTQPRTRSSATVNLSDNSSFREFVTMFSDNLRISNAASAVNYRTEPFPFRYPNNFQSNTADFSCMLSNQLVNNADPQTPVFNATVGERVRFRLVHTFGTGTSQVFTLHGHAWQRNPYKNNSTQLGDNNLSQWLGSRDNHGSTDHADLLVSKAGGEGARTGDYLFTMFVPIQASQGPWGILRVNSNTSPVSGGSNGSSGSTTTNPACVQAAPPPPTTTLAPSTKDDLDRFVRRPLNSTTPRP